MSDLLLVGASGLAREVLAVLRRTGTHDSVAVVDDDPATWGTELDGAPVIGRLSAVGDHPRAEVLVCVGHGAARRRVVDRLAGLGVGPDRYATLVHPSADVAPGCVVGPGSVLLAQVVLTADVALGRHVVAMPQVVVTHDGAVGDHATLCAGVALGGSVVVGEAAYVGMNAAVRERVVLGAGCTVGMGAVVLDDVPAGEVWAGVPARPLRALEVVR